MSYRRKRRYSKRTKKPYSRRNRRTKKSTVWKTSTKAAKAVINRMSETKRLIVQFGTTGIPSSSAYWESFENIFRPFVNGFLHNQVDGSEIYTTWYRVTGRLFMNIPQASQGAVGNVSVRLDLLHSKNYIYNGTKVIGVSAIPGQMFSNNTSILSLKSYDSDYVKVIASKKIFFDRSNNPGTTGNALQELNWDWKVKLKGKKKFALPTEGTPIETVPGVLKEGQYYLAIRMTSSGSTGLSGVCRVDYDQFFYFKDF